MSRDPQKQRVYAADHRVWRWLDLDSPITMHGSVWQPETEVRFGCVDSVQRYVDRVLEHIGWNGRCTVRARRGNTKAHYEPHLATIAVPPMPTTGHGQSWAMREAVVLHELAHHLTRWDEAHGPEFAAAQVFLWEETGHPVLARMHQIALLEEGVSIADKNFR